MKTELPSIVITGASGFVGRHLLDFVKDYFTVFAIARRSASEAVLLVDHDGGHAGRHEGLRRCGRRTL